MSQRAPSSPNLSSPRRRLSALGLLAGLALAGRAAAQADAPTPSASGSAAPTDVVPVTSAVPSSAPPAAEAPSATPPAAPPAAPPPSATPPPATSSAAPSAPAASAEATPAEGQAEEKKLPPIEQAFAIEGSMGVMGRLDPNDTGLDQGANTAFVPRIGVWYAPSRVWAFGLGYEGITLGADRSGPGAATDYRINRSLLALWLNARAYPYRSSWLGVYVQLGIGIGWQRAEASGLVIDATQTRVFRCSASDGPGLALGGGAGLDFDLSRSVSLTTQIDLAAHRQDAATLGGCAPGVSTVTGLNGRIGLAYRFDLGGN